MRIAPKLAVPFVLILALSACTPEAIATPPATPQPSVSDTPTPTPIADTAECRPTPLDVTITYELTTDASGGVTIDATSNLPDGSEMNASFFVEGGYFAQDEGTLEDGMVSFGPFSNKGTPLQGSYDMSITLRIRQTPGQTLFSVA